MKSSCPHGHPYPESLRPGRRDCAVCHREAQLRRARARGVQPHTPRTECSEGHPFPESLRPGRSDCAICHREREHRRYHSDPEKHRNAASEYQKKNRQERNAYLRDYYKRNLQKQREYNRLQQRWRSVGKNNEALAYSEILRSDPCAYCGGPAGTIDHIEPVIAGGSNDWDNLTAACNNCNSQKRKSPLLIFLSRSWGKDWGRDGYCYVSRESMAFLLAQDGEAMIPTVRRAG